MEQTPEGALRRWRLYRGQVGVAGPEAESAHSEMAKARPSDAAVPAMRRFHGTILNPLNWMNKFVGATLSRPRGRAVARIGMRGFTVTGRDKPVPDDSVFPDVSRPRLAWDVFSTR